MSYSLNEIDALSKRAARGAGMSWGISEEAGKAVRWLASHQLQGVEAFVALLSKNDGKAVQEIAPVSLDGVWFAPSGDMCPLLSGAALSDCAKLLSGTAEIEFENVSQPLLLAPFAAWAALQIQSPIELRWMDIHFATDGYGIWNTGSRKHLGVSRTDRLVCAKANQRAEKAKAPMMRGEVSSSTWRQLNEFAHRTYAPATEESRLLGAGASETDND